MALSLYTPSIVRARIYDPMTDPKPTSAEPAAGSPARGYASRRQTNRSREGLAPCRGSVAAEGGYDPFSINRRMLGRGEFIRIKEGERVLFHVLNASATEIRRLALPGHVLRMFAFDGNPVSTPRVVARHGRTRLRDRRDEAPRRAGDGRISRMISKPRDGHRHPGP